MRSGRAAAVRRAGVIAWVNLKRTLRDRTAAFFLFIFPFLIILVLGFMFGSSSEPKVAVVREGGGELAARLETALLAADDLAAHAESDAAKATSAVERGEMDAVVVIPADYDALVLAGQDVRVRYVNRPGQQGLQIESILRGVVADEAGRLRAAGFFAAETGEPLPRSLAAVEAAGSSIPALTVTSRSTGESTFAPTLGRFDLGASSQLVLFVFLTTLTTAAAIIETRKFGLLRREISTPTHPLSIVAGEALGRLAVAGTQALVIMLGSALLFGVSWGDPLAAGVLITSFALVASGAGLLLGAAARTEAQSLGFGLLGGLGLAALGGAMLPLELFSPTMRDVAHFTPHAWAVEGFTKLVRHGGGLVEILPYTGVLLGMAAVLLSIAAWLLRRSIAD